MGARELLTSGERRIREPQEQCEQRVHEQQPAAQRAAKPGRGGAQVEARRPRLALLRRLRVVGNWLWRRRLWFEGIARDRRVGHGVPPGFLGSAGSFASVSESLS